MESYPCFTEIPHITPMSPTTSLTYAAYPTQPTGPPFMTRVSQLQFQSPMDQPKSLEASLTPQAWWSHEELDLNRGYGPADYTVCPEPFSPWNSGASTISDPQSPRSSTGGSAGCMNCMASSPFQHEEIPISTVGEQSEYPAMNGLVDIDRLTMKPQLPILDTQSNHLSPCKHDFDPWVGSQSDCNETPERQWSSPLLDPTARPQVTRRSQNLSSSSSKIRKALGRKPTNTPVRNRRGRSSNSESHGDAKTPRTFICSFAPYGCESTFVSKNEWKRHVTSKHLQLGFYRCDVGKCGVSTHQTSQNHFVTVTPSPKSTSSTPTPGQPNDFNRKDLFTQHQRRMHAPWLRSNRRRTATEAESTAFEESLDEVRQRCWHQLRHPPHQSHCGFCRELFVGSGSWDARMEHVGRHFEREDRLGEELEDLSLREWGLREGVLTLVGGECRLAISNIKSSY